MEREAFLYVKAKLLNSSMENRNDFGSGKVHFNLTGTYMNDPEACPISAKQAAIGPKSNVQRFKV